MGTRLRAVTVILFACTMFAGPAVATVSAADPASAADIQGARWYRQCMQLTDVDPQQALKRAEEQSKADGGVPAGHCAAVALVRLERFAAGATRFEELAGKSDRPDLRAALLDQAAGAWLLAGNGERAVRLLQAAVEIAPKDANLRIDKAAAEAELGHYDRAADELDQAIALDPAIPDAYALRASARRRLNQLDAAAADLEQALSLDPHHSEALLERGILRQLRGDRAGARADWDSVVETASGSAAAAAAQVNLSELSKTAPR